MWLLLASFLSGASGLIFEMAWFHRSSLVFGGSVWSTTLVLSSFMGGLTVGSALVGACSSRIRNPVRLYGTVEIVVALAGALLTLALPALTHAIVALSRPSEVDVWLTNVVRFVSAFSILLVPSTAMGATLPLLVAALAPRRGDFGRALGQAYGWNTLGAVAGVLAAEVWLIATLGIFGTASIAALLSLTAATLALRLGSGDVVSSATAATTPATGPASSRSSKMAAPRAPSTTRPLLACSFLSGAALLALEVVWFRFLTMFVLSTTLAASVMLAVVLGGIGIGGLVASTWLKRSPLASTNASAVAFAAACSVVATYAGFGIMTAGTQVGAVGRTLWFAVALTFPTSLLSGILFTLFGDALQRAIAAETRAAAWLALANTAGGMLGPLLAAFVMLPSLGMERSFLVVSIVYAGIGAIALLDGPAPAARLRSPASAVGVAAAAVALLWFPSGMMRDRYFARVVQPYGADGASIVASREGPSETIFLMQQKWMNEPVYTRLVTNGFSMSGTSVPASRYMRYFVYWPLTVHRGPIKRVLVVCYGVGVTAGAALDLPSAETIDVAEISADIVAASDAIYPANHPLRDPRVRLHLEDGRQFLETTTETYDLITGEPPPPRTPGAVNIYSRDYFQLAHDRLAEGGIVTYWLPVGRPDPGTNVNAIIRAFCDVFADCSLWNATPFDLMLAGSRNASGALVEDEFVMPWTHGSLRSRFAEVGIELPQQIGATFLGDATYLRQLTDATPPVTDDRPQRLRPVPGRPSISDPGYGVDPSVTRLYESVLDPARARLAFAASPYIRRLWSPKLIEATLPYFDHQAAMNRVFWEGGRPLQQIETLHWLLSETPLRTLPLWILGSDYVKEGIARRHDDGTGAAEYARGLSALATRDYLAAAELFAQAEGRGLRGETVRPLRVYALCLGWRLDLAKALAGERSDSAEQKHFWEWLGKKFGI